MQLASPFFLILLIIIPLLFIASGWLYKRTITPVVRFSDFNHGFAAGVQKMRQTFSVKALPMLKILRFIVLALLIVTLARPQLSQSREHQLAKGIDILLVLDISESMRAEDFEGANRIETAKLVINDFLAHRENDRIGLVVFAGESFTLCPLTLDYAVLVELLNDVKLGQLEDGTAIGDALATATHRLRVSQSKTKIVILLTDGENTAGSINPGAAASLAESSGIKVYTIGMGKEGGARIPYADMTFGKRYREVLTYLDEDTLKQIAQTTGGRYFRAIDTQSLKQIYAEIDRFEKTEFKTVNTVAHKELATYFLIPAVLLLGIEILLSNTVLRKIP
ncbi:VWA domain-containing protein [Candidatus Poribacteria bacterium]|nr:VWA domain-containing protein [Candidatus Poribacteria bacterium]MYG06402.1 VWA domain-containing protein [Candidatus Poribacteria bacterium]MYK24121.1 VWA domain-containing protein [Candidatus Poribacteria bacterium]